MGEVNIIKDEKEKNNSIKVIKNILIIMVIPVIFFVLKLLPFIFVPLVSAVFLAILFTPLMRWFKKKRVPKIAALAGVVIIIMGFFVVGSELVKLSSSEIMSSDTDLLIAKMESKLADITAPVEKFFGIDKENGGKGIDEMFQGKDNADGLIGFFGVTLNLVQKFITQVLMMFFFLLLFLSGSIDMEKLMNSTVVKQRATSLKTMLKIEKSIVKFIKVKFILSALTGIGFSLACWGMDVSFPIFWGLFAFAVNFVQMVGSVVAVILCGLFALAEIDDTGTLMVFWLLITGVEVLFGGILEPILMGKTFSINTVTVLVMLMLWGYIWGIPGLIMSIPITVLIKIILEQNPRTQVIAKVLS
ncbi:MAG: AI-2E family transporter [Flavobacteriales bacterium]|nr:AI-2E family transporter [Flavobacteriales bacterium]